MVFLPDFIERLFLKTVFPKTFLTVKKMFEFDVEVKLILVELVKGFGAADKPSIDFSCENPNVVILKNKIKSIFFIIC